MTPPKTADIPQGDVTAILLVEDNLADVELIRVMLEPSARPSGAFELAVVDCLADAKDALASQEFQLILLDLGLPDSDGVNTLRAFLKDHSTSPVIVLTGITDEEMAVESVNCGAQDFLFKDNLDARLLRRSIRYSMERYRLEQEQQRLSAELLNAISMEQQRIARELHDEVGQGLAGLNMMARSLSRKLRLQDPREVEKSRMISDGIQGVLDSFRRVLCGLSPVDLDEQALPVALRRLCTSIQQTGIECSFCADPAFTMKDNSIATHLYRIAQESLTNAMRHAGAERLHVTLARQGPSVLLSVADDGAGFDPEDVEATGMGLRILRHRSKLIGGSLQIRSGNSGTTVLCEVDSNGQEYNC